MSLRTSPLPIPLELLLLEEEKSPGLSTIKQAWKRLEEILHDYLEDARLIEEYMIKSSIGSTRTSLGTSKKLRSVDAYLDISHGVLSYTSNIVLITGEKGSGKSTLLATQLHFRTFIRIIFSKRPVSWHNIADGFHQ